MGRIDGNKAIIAADNDIIDTAVAAVSSKLWLPPLMPVPAGRRTGSHQPQLQCFKSCPQRL
jgi:hypothetical protein